MKTLTTLHRTAIAGAIMGVIALASMVYADVTKVSGLRVEQSGDNAKYVIEQTGEAAYQEFLLSNPRRLVVDIVGARHDLAQTSYDGDGRLVKAVRTSQFTSDPDEVTRVVFDLGESTKYSVSRTGNSVEIMFSSDAPVAAMPPVMEASAGSDSEWNADIAAAPILTPAPAPEEIPAPAPKTEAPAPSQWSAPAPAAPAAPAETPAAKPVEVAVANPWADGGTSTSQTRSYPAELSAYTNTASNRMSNDKLSMDVQGADIKTVLRSIAEFSGSNILAGPEVEGPVTIHLKNVSWREALDLILKSNGYGIKEDYGIIRVQTLEVLQNEEVSMAQVRQKKEDLEPLVSKVVELSYVNAKEMQIAMDKVTTKRGNISVEKGSNAVIINDVPNVAERIAAMVTNLDKKVKQVEITAKLVDVDVEATRELGIQWDFMNIMNTNVNGVANGFSGQKLTDPFGSVTVGSVTSWGDVMATVEALERDNKANIVSNPRITTADNNEATILVGKEIPLIVSDVAGNPITELKKVGVTLRVTPHVNSDNSITLDMHPEISELSSQATVQGGIIISLTEADTRVLVQNGETAVIGGLVQEVESSLKTGVPGLKNIPFFGALFRYESKTKKKRELVIFVTPRLVEFEGKGGGK